MRVNLALCLFLVFYVNEINGREESKFKKFDLKPLKSSVQQSKDSAPEGPFCESIVAYYIGTLRNKKSSKTYDIEFQVKLWADKKRKRIHVYADKWNEEFSKSEEFELDYYYDGNRDWCDIYSDDCTLAFAKKETNFTIDLNTADGNYFHLLSFNFFNNSFGLTDPVDKCTKHQLSGLNDDVVPNLDKPTFCVCCDDYKPNKLLGCPSNDWSNKETTCPTLQCPKPVTPAPIQRSTIPPPFQSKNITCKNVVGYYDGVFKNKVNPAVVKSVKFELRVNANDTEKLIYFYIDQWDENESNSSAFALISYNWVDEAWCGRISNSSCSTQYVNGEKDWLPVVLDYENTQSGGNQYEFLWFPDFYNAFKLTNVIGQCTKNQWQNQYLDPNNGDWKPNTRYYDYCLCCGNSYNPDSSLGCPRNPWA